MWWDEYETAILLNGCVSILEGAEKRKVIEEVSENLRDLAACRGYKLDKTFRNIPGVTLKMGTIQYYFTNGESGMKNSNPSKMFKHIVNLYRTNRATYNEILSRTESYIQHNYNLNIGNDILGLDDNINKNIHKNYR